jgi:integrase
MALLLYTGQCRSDVVTMGPQHIDKKGAIHVRQVKTGAALVIPVHSALQTIIDVTVTEQPKSAANVVSLAKPLLTIAFD